MKKLISLFIALATFAIGCMPTAMASFVMPEMEMSKSMQHETMSSSDCCDTMSSDCTESSHECCFSPFKDGAVTWNIISQNEDKKFKWKVLDINVLALVQESLEYNYNEKLTSPPKWNDWEKEGNLYITLTGIIKSNC